MTVEEKIFNVIIPDNAKLKDVIFLLNRVGLTINVNTCNADVQKWIYEHEDWFSIYEDDYK